MWTTLRVDHMPTGPKTAATKTEQNEKCVTHVIGQKCYPCSRLHKVEARYGVVLTPEVGPQSLTGGAALPTGVLSDGAFSKSNMSSSVSAN